MDRNKLGGILIILIWSFVLQNNSIAQEFSPRFRQYNNAEGLSQSVVMAIFQDSKNYLWFGTEDGLNKFDGYNFKIYRYDPEDSSSISDNWIERIHLEDSDGDIWVETADRNINVFNPRTDRFVKVNTSNKGLLPFNQIIFIRQDKNGLIWIATAKGLFSIEKKNWKIRQVYINNSADNPRLFRYLLDDGENVWIGSNKGLLIWNKKNLNVSEKYPDESIQGIQQIDKKIWLVTEDKIIGIEDKFNNQKIINFGSLLGPEAPIPGLPMGKDEVKRKRKFSASVKKDNNNNLWICSRRGLIFFDSKKEEANAFLNNPADKTSISSNYIITFYQDQKGNFWFGTSEGLNQYLPDKKNFVRVCQKSVNSSRAVHAICEDKTGRIWVVDQVFQGEGSHLYFLDQKAMQLIQVKKKAHDPGGLPVDVVYDPFIDHNDNIWFGTYSSGVLLYSPFQKGFDLIKHIPENVNTIAGPSSWAMSEDNKNRIWIAIYQDGLDCYDPASGKVVHYGDKLNSFLGVTNACIITVICDNYNRVWIGTMGQGVVCLDINTGKFTIYQNRPGEKNQISSNFTYSITKDKYDNLLLAHPDNGLDIMNLKTGKVTNYRNIPGDSNSLYSNTVRYAMGTSDGNYWISTDGALTFFDPAKKIMKHYLTRKSGGKGILSDKASCIYEDLKGNIWVGTHGGGLSLFDKKKDEFNYWVEKNGLINNVIYGILEDKNGRLWLSTNKGISCFDPATSVFTSYFENDGLQGSEFNQNSFLKDKKGKMYFGGINGITAFYPENIQPDKVPPQVAITDFQIFNKKVEVLPTDKANLISDRNSARVIEDNGHFYLPENVSYVNKVELNYNYKVFTFEFAALRFDMPERCTFMYKMEGFEKEWNMAGRRRFATYTNLPPGEYVFKVTAANADGIWNPEPVKMEITIKPPFYLTWWFISLGVASLIMASTSFVMKREKNLKRTKSLLEEKVKLRTLELNGKNEELTLRNIQILKQKEEIASQARRLRDELDSQNQTSEQALLRSQINPHFLFNTLNNIYSLVYQKSTGAPEAVMKLSEIMRYMLYDTSADLVFLDKEIQYLKSFIELQLLRLKNKDFVHFEITGDPSGKKITPMLLIPFIENAFKHGNKNASPPGVVIKLDCSFGAINLQVKNTKNNSAIKDCLGGIGLANVKRRLELIYQDKYKLEIVDIDNKFEIDLLIPEN